MPRLALLPLLALALACSSPAEERTSTPGVGIEVFPGWYASFDEPILLLEDGGDLPLRMAPQGGHWAFVSARVRGFSGDAMSVGARLLDAKTGELLFAERRSGGVIVSPNDPSAVEPELDLRGAIVHIPVCPMEVPPGLFARALRLEIDIGGAEEGSATLTVTPSCSAGSPGEQAVCACECAADYDPGKCY